MEAPDTLTIGNRVYGLSRVADGFLVEKADGTMYEVTEGPSGPVCSCPDATYRRNGMDSLGCRHAQAIRAAGLMPVPTLSGPVPEFSPSTEIDPMPSLSDYGLAPISGGSEEASTKPPRLKDITEDFVERLVYAKAAEYKTKAEHWINDSDESLSYCFECAEKEVARLKAKDLESEAMVDGGRGGESDSLPFCETCGEPLDSSLTTYGCESELDHFEEYGFDLDSSSDCYSMERILGSTGFLNDELTPRIKRVILKAIKVRAKGKEAPRG